MTPRRRRPRLEPLEGRDTPGILTFTYVAATRSLTVVGTSSNNQLSINDSGSGQLVLSSATDAFRGSDGLVLNSPMLFPSRVDNLTVRLLGGDDAVVIGTNPIRLAGGLVVAGGDGNNTLTVTSLSVDGNLTVTNGAGTDSTLMTFVDVGGSLSVANGAGDSTTAISLTGRDHPFVRSLAVTNGAGTDSTTLTNVNVAGSVAVRNGAGDSHTVIGRDVPGHSLVGGSVTVTNGTGVDETELADTSVIGNVTVQNGHGGATGSAGHTWVDNPTNQTRSVIGGNVSVSYLDGNVTAAPDVLLDVQVLGNVTFNHGRGSSDTLVDGDLSALPVIVRGNLTFTGSGRAIIRHFSSPLTFGLIVGGDFRMTAGPGDDMVSLYGAEVGGQTVLNLGDGANIVLVDDSEFHGPVTITTGAGADTVSLDTTAGTAAPTTFERPVLIRLGAGDDRVSLGGPADAMQRLVVFAPFVIHHGAGADDISRFGSEESPLGWGIEYVL
ncbi:MAG: hypothetical protein J2P46_06040 [Zavarzinella sp.]|nr:hypothetical protein [Zavarzinella sp.]